MTWLFAIAPIAAIVVFGLLAFQQIAAQIAQSLP